VTDLLFELPASTPDEDIAPEALAGVLHKPVRVAASVLAVAAAAATMLVGFLQKAPCLSSQRSSQCYSDIGSLWYLRDLGSHALPYVHGGIQSGRFTGHELEYPVLTGVFVWLTSLGAHSEFAFTIISTLALAPFGLLTAWLLAKLTGHRALFFAVAPVLAWYSFLNWDLLGVCAAVAAIYAWRRDRFILAAFLLTIGGCFKLWPAYLLGPLALDLICRRQVRLLWRAAGIVLTTVMAVNLPLAILNYSGWKAPFVFQALRPPDISASSLWSVLTPWAGVATVNSLSELACGAAFAGILWYGYRRFRREGAYPFIQASAAMVATFIALGKVHSPQYSLWVLPFFALLEINQLWWALFCASDVWLFAQFSMLRPFDPYRHTGALIVADLVLIAIALVALRSRASVGGKPGGPQLLDDRGHEVHVARPARQDVHVEVVGHAGAGGSAQVGPMSISPGPKAARTARRARVTPAHTAVASSDMWGANPGPEEDHEGSQSRRAPVPK
jgi:hypothetical protein